MPGKDSFRNCCALSMSDKYVTPLKTTEIAFGVVKTLSDLFEAHIFGVVDGSYDRPNSDDEPVRENDGID